MDNEKQKILAKYEQKNISTFYQIDFWTGVQPGDCVMKPDGEGDCLTSIHPSRELMDGSVVRVFFRNGISQSEAVRGLKKALQWVEKGSGIPSVEIDSEIFSIERPLIPIISNYVDPD